jgi:hypothetical protein
VLAGLFLIGASLRGFAGEELLRKNVLSGIIGIVFAIAGLAIVAAGVHGARRADAEAALRARHPGEPWMWNPAWTDRRISDRSRASTLSLWLFTFFWNGVSSPVAFFLPAELEKGNRLGGTPTPWYDLEIVPTIGKPKTIGRSIRDKREAGWILERVRERLALANHAHARN